MVWAAAVVVVSALADSRRVNAARASASGLSTGTVGPPLASGSKRSLMAVVRAPEIDVAGATTGAAGLTEPTVELGLGAEAGAVTAA
ncbi:hypothetical protein MANY_35320 [Mycolicibacterium anyangense]|uniref:Uncharacterized protein n=1 Tax=Mycolicibacterium anyangense TaxID=1431246 RepID=A0A6N4WBQ1_9MYCO|nr:hypothetical protein MANY_35320 [Mycolicibacterium anyangense]